MKFDHIGIPTTEEREWSAYLADCKLHVSDYSKDPFRVEWLKFEEGSSMPKELQIGAHIAYEVENLDAALAGRQVLIEPFEPKPGVRCAFILHLGLPVELMQKV
ncbi:MAG: hypothetical protein LBT05_03645 [Planctomycetaceae bacterium]|jgi:hypothetical protein|nr:hypothetical protein [Planctomycetaceae bacterium]